MAGVRPGFEQMTLELLVYNANSRQNLPSLKVMCIGANSNDVWL
jgi:hypothetical protein